MLHNEMGVINEAITTLITWIDTDLEKTTGRRTSQEDKNEAAAKTKKERRDNFADGTITLG
jgi:hypothetical protein